MLHNPLKGRSENIDTAGPALQSANQVSLKYYILVDRGPERLSSILLPG